MKSTLPADTVVPDPVPRPPLKKALHWIKSNSIILANAGSLVGTTAVTSLLGFVYWWLAARQYTPEAVGFASAAISAMTLIGTFSILGLGTLLLGELPLHKGREGSLISTGLIVVGAVGGLLGLLFAFISPYFAVGFKPLGINLGNILIFALGVSLTAVTLVLDDALIGLFRGELQLWRNSLFSLVKLVALFLASLWLSRTLGMTIYTTWVIGNTFSLLALAGYAIVRRAGRRGSYLPDWSLLKKLGPPALKHHFLNITLQAPTLILPVMVTVMLSTTINAWFYVSWNLSSIANIFSAALTLTLFASSAAQPGTLAQKIRLTMTLAFVACVAINVVYLFGTKQVLGLFGPGYAEQATWSLRILSIESFPFIIKNHYIAVSRIRGQVAHAARLTVITGLLEVSGAGIGAFFGGLTGLSLGWFFAMCLEVVFMSPTVFKAARFFQPATDAAGA